MNCVTAFEIDEIVATIDDHACATGGMDSAELAVLAAGMTRIRRSVERVNLAIAIRSDTLAGQGAGGGAEDLFNRDTPGTGEGRRQARRATASRAAPRVGDAVANGTLAAEYLDVIARITAKLDATTRRAFEALDTELAEAARRMDVHAFTVWCRNRLERLSAELGRDRDQRQRRDTKARHWVDGVTGLHHLSASFYPELGQRLFAALDADVNALRAMSSAQRDEHLPGLVLEGMETDRDHLMAHSIARMIIADHRTNRPGVAEVCIYVDDDTLHHGAHEHSMCEYSDGTPASVATARHLACDSHLRRVIMGTTAEDLELGRSARLASHAQRLALRAIYRTCGLPDCTVPFDHCEIHHLDEWDDGGPTDIDNLLPVCRRQHHLLHHQGWSLSLDAARTLTITRHDGSIHSITPLEPPWTPTRRQKAPPRRQPSPPESSGGPDPRSTTER